MVHLFDPLNAYQPLASIDDHTSAVNSILFVEVCDKFFYVLRKFFRLLIRYLTNLLENETAVLQEANNLHLISSAADRSIVIRKMVDSKVIL